MADIASLSVKITADVKNAMDGLSKFQDKLSKSKDEIQKIGSKMSTFVTLPIVGAGVAAFKMASDMAESLNKVDVAFGDSEQSVLDWSKTTLQSFGIARGTALDMVSLFGDMATGMGLTTEESANMSMSLVGLAGDLASFKNVGIDQAQNALKGIFTGETESLKSLGVVMNDTTLSAYAMANGFEKDYSEMTQAEKVALRYQFVMDATKNSQGDFSRTSDGSANQMRIFSESLKEVSALFGEVLLPILTPIIQKLNEFLGWLSGLDAGTRAWVVGILGIVAAIGPMLLMVAKAITIYEQLKKLTILQTVAQGILNATWLGFPVVWIIAGIVALIAIVWALWNNWDTITQFISEAWEKIKIAFSNALNSITIAVSGWVKSISDFFKGLFNGLVYVIVHFNLWSLLNDYIIKPFLKIDLFEIGKNVIQGFLDGAKSLFKNIGKFFLDLLPDWIVGPFKLALGIKSPSKVFAGFGENIGQGLVNGMDDTLGMIKDASLGMADVSLSGMPISNPIDPVISIEQTNQQKPGDQVIEIRFGDQIYRTIIDGINEEQRRSGRTLIEV